MLELKNIQLGINEALVSTPDKIDKSLQCEFDEMNLQQSRQIPIFQQTSDKFDVTLQSTLQVDPNRVKLSRNLHTIQERPAD